MGESLSVDKNLINKKIWQRRHWHESRLYLLMGNIVLVHDQLFIENQCIVEKVVDTKLNTDGLIQSYTVEYNSRSVDQDSRYSDGIWIEIQMCIQNLALLFLIEEQVEEPVSED